MDARDATISAALQAYRPSDGTDDNKRQLERNVIEAAVAWVNAESWDQRHNAEGDISAAVRNLTAAKGPQPVDPQTLAPGTRFRFNYQDTETIRVAVRHPQSGRMLWVNERDASQFSDTKGACVIPLKD